MTIQHGPSPAPIVQYTARTPRSKPFVYFAPPTEPGMIECVAVPGDNLLRGVTCPHCIQGFDAGDVLFQSADFKVAIHKSCLVALAQPALDELERHEQIRARILSTGSLAGDE